MSSGIYEIVCSPTGQRYIGQSINTTWRLAVHRSRLARHVHENRFLQAAWDEHGEQSFLFQTLETTILDRDVMTERERHYVNQYQTLDPARGFNGRIPTRPATPPPGPSHRPTNIMLRHDQWQMLLDIEKETGAGPSFTLRKMIDERLALDESAA